MTEEMKQENQQAPSEVSSQAEDEALNTDKGSEENWAALVAQKDEEIKQLKEKVLRIAAEMENTRKRLERERADGICYANESLVRAILPVLDNLDRAIEHGENEANAQDLLEGVRMTLKGFLDTLSKFGCTSFESVGKPFDPNYHEAMMQEESSEHPENTVLREFQKGYKLRDRLIRPAMVVVSKAGAAPHSVGEDSELSENSEPSEDPEPSEEGGNPSEKSKPKKIKISVK